MEVGSVLRRAREAAGLTQRAVAEISGIAQPAIARIESGAVTPRVDTLERLLAACGRRLVVEGRLGQGVDRTVIRRLLDLSPRERIELAAREARNVTAFEEAIRR
jgi:transcriptional regulator with XRE-family HTH domain